MSQLSSSFQDHIDAGNDSPSSCPLVLKENNVHSDYYNKNTACEQVLNQIGESTTGFADSDMFSLKLTQIQSQNAGENHQNQADHSQQKKSKISAIDKNSHDGSNQTATDSLVEQVMAIETYLQAQRVALIKSLDHEVSQEQRRDIMNSFFDVLQNQTRNLTRQIKIEISKKSKKLSPVKSPGKKSSPKKSPQKKENDFVGSESSFGSPEGKDFSKVEQTFYSPGKDQKGQQRSSQQRKQKNNMDEEGASFDGSRDVQFSKRQNSSPTQEKLTLPKSPVKRMRQLEEQQNRQDHEDVETAYQKSPDKALTSTALVSQTTDQEDTVAKEVIAKSLLQPSSAAPQTPVQTETQETQNVVDINDILDIDSNVINYGQFICGKILGSTLLLTNISGQEQVINMSISRQQKFDCDCIFGQYNREELPFEYQDGAFIKNSEIEFSCWFIENPLTKELQKQITLKIGPQMSQEFIIVIKAPKNRLQAKIVSFIDIKMGDDETATPTEKHVHHSSTALVTKEQPIPRKLDILLLGFLDNPKIKCMKQLYSEVANSDLISLAVKKAAGIQKFKLPFKNLSSYLDSDVEFAFIRAPQAPTNAQNSKSASSTAKNSFSFEPIDCLQFYCQPNQFKISADQIQILTVQIKVNTDMLNDGQKVDQRQLKYPLNKLLVARLKNSQILFSFFVSLTLVD